MQLREDWHCGLLSSVSCELRDDWETLQRRLQRSAAHMSAHQQEAQASAAALEVAVGRLDPQPTQLICTGNVELYPFCPIVAA